MDIRKQMDDIYRDMPLDEIPWNMSEPPAPLVEAVESFKVMPCKAVDLGCGAGNYAVWLARHGFEVTGLDISAEAIRHARALAQREEVDVHFETADLLGDVSRYRLSFDFAYDYELLHHIFPDDRERYVENVHSMIRVTGVYFSLCFSEEDPGFGGKGKYRRTQLGTELYFSSEAELRALFGGHFNIIQLETIEIEGKYGPHRAVAAWMSR